MIKTLKITSIAVAILAVVFFVFSVAFGVRSDKSSEQFLSSVGAIEKFNKAKGNRTAGRAGSDSQISPLVKQAERFALYLNPPPKPKKPTTTRRGPSIRPKPKAVSAKFKLVGTSFHQVHPELSIALIDQPGKGFQWVRQSGKVGHLVIEKIKDGVIVVRDGKRTFEMTAERPKKRSLVKGAFPTVAGSAVRRSQVDKSALPVLRRTRAEARKIKTSTGTPQMSDERTKWTEKIFAELEAVQERVAAGQIDQEQGDKESGALMDKLVSGLEFTHIGPEEANKLGDLGEELDSVDVQLGYEPNDSNVGAEPNRTSHRRDKRKE